MNPIEDTAQADLWPTVHPLVAASYYLVLATAGAEGRPWTTPLLFALLDEDHLLWVSSPQSRHSRNLRTRPEAAMTVFDSHAPFGRAGALYLEANVSSLPGDKREVGCARLNARCHSARVSARMTFALRRHFGPTGTASPSSPSSSEGETLLRERGQHSNRGSRTPAPHPSTEHQAVRPLGARATTDLRSNRW